MGDLYRTVSPYTGHVPLRHTTLMWLLQHPVSEHTSDAASVAFAKRELVELVRGFVEDLTGGFARLITHQRPHLIHQIRIIGGQRLVPEIGPETGRVHLHFNMRITHTMYDKAEHPGYVGVPEVRHRLPASGLHVPDIRDAMVTMLTEQAARPVPGLNVLVRLTVAGAFDNYAVKEDQEREFVERFRSGEIRLEGRGRARGT